MNFFQSEFDNAYFTFLGSITDSDMINVVFIDNLTPDDNMMRIVTNIRLFKLRNNSGIISIGNM